MTAQPLSSAAAHAGTLVVRPLARAGSGPGAGQAAGGAPGRAQARYKSQLAGDSRGAKGAYQANKTVRFARAHVAANFRGAICGGAVEEGVKREFEVCDEAGA